MNTELFARIAQNLQLKPHRVESCITLIEEGATIPFISRYRKEATGSMNEVEVAAVAEQYQKYKELEKRKESILSTIEEQGKLSDALRQRIEDCWEANLLEDIYLPYKPKRRTRAQIAREQGLEPLAQLIEKEYFSDEAGLRQRAKSFCKDKLESIEEVLQGARDIVAENINENETCRSAVRREFQYTATIVSKVVKGKAEEADKYRDYFDFSESLKHCSSHRLLAMRRGEKEGFLRVSIQADEENCLQKLYRINIRKNNASSRQLELAVEDAFKRLLKPSIENEFASLSKEKADAEAIAVFAKGLRQVLLASPLGAKRILGIDPGFRTGCKVVCIDAQGNLCCDSLIFPHPPKADPNAAGKEILRLVDTYDIQAIAIGNGTAGRETESFVRSLGLPKDIDIFMVNEDGASIYSASAIAREEFPDKDVTVRGAVSIARRLMDPLAELVKIDSKSIGVGQYQHDVDQTALKHQLDLVVESCVNAVGVEVNTASKHLLSYVSGLGPALAQNIVQYRQENGAFRSRKELMKVPRMGAKAFQQCAGFLRISNAENPLDNSAVHPESYAIVESMAKDLRCTVADLMKSTDLRARIDKDKYSQQAGEETLKDIFHELEKPGRDPRKALESFRFDDSIKQIDDIKVGMILPGIVSNITNFGCFVDLGVHVKGLIHISQMADRFVKDPSEVVHIGEQVHVRVIEVDSKRQRIALSLKNN
ncbi:MAG: RNA-binding transcriptional accessory protein [Bacteroidales bacterium]|nr:RNA-binding transcriptional accessory protein [Bacteroidales bacterium]